MSILPKTLTMERLLVFFTLSAFFWSVQGDFQDDMDEACKDFKILGMAAGAVTTSEENPLGDWIMKGECGVRLAGDETPIGPEDKFYLGAGGKAVTALMAARLVEAGVIRWNSTVQEVLVDTGIIPAVSTAHQDDTLLDLMLKKANIPTTLLFAYDTDLMDFWDEAFSITTWEGNYDSMVIRLEMAKIMFGVDWVEAGFPEESMLESDMSYSLATVLLEASSGMGFASLIEKEVFAPLQMNGCHLGPTTLDPSTPPVQPWAHLAGPWGVYNIPITPSNTATDASWLAPDAGISCDLDSIKVLLATHIEKPADYLAESWELILNKQVDSDDQGNTLGWGFGGDEESELRFLYNIGGYINTAWIVLLPDLDAGMVAVANTPMVGGMRQQVGFNRVWESLFDQTIEAIPFNETTGWNIAKIRGGLLKI